MSDNTECPLCSLPMVIQIPPDQPENILVSYCCACGPYLSNVDISNLPKDNPHWQQVAIKSNTPKYHDIPAYRRFLTYLRNLMAKDRLRRFTNDKDATSWPDYPATITEPMLESALTKKVNFNTHEQVENAIRLFAQYGQYDELPWIVAPEDLGPEDEPGHIRSQAKNQKLFDLRCIGIDIQAKTVLFSQPPQGTNTKQAAEAAHDLTRYLLRVMCNGHGLINIPLHLQRHTMIDSNPTPVTLTLTGWQYYKSLLEESNISDVAFMAMGFSPPNRWAYDNIFKKCAEVCGFMIQTVDESPKFGSIHADMELKIKSAPFVIVDLSGGNNGAYWEAGYAKGLGKSVIYTCNQETWKSAEPQVRRHFDIIADQTIEWNNLDSPEAHEENIQAMKRLISNIRNTVTSAKLSGEPIDDEVKALVGEKEVIYKPGNKNHQ